MNLLLKIIFVSGICSLASACTWSHDGSCYNYVKQGLDFWPAETYCNTMYGGHLVAINSQEESDFITGRLLEAGHNNDSMLKHC